MTRLEVANKIWKDVFGIAKRFDYNSCVAHDCDICPLVGDECKYYEEGNYGCKEWWNEEYKGAEQMKGGGEDVEVQN